MATIQPVIVEQVPGSTSPNGAALFTWPNMANGDVGAPAGFPTHADRSVQVGGTFGAGGTVLVEGSLEIAPLNYVTLNDPQGVALSITAAKVKAVAENTTWIRPRVSGGDGSTLVNVSLLVRRQP